MSDTRSRIAFVCVWIFLAAGTGLHGVQAATISVNTVDDVVADDGQCSLREAITAVNLAAASGVGAGECIAGDSNNDTIAVPAGTYTLSIAGIDEDNNASGDLDIRANVTVQGAGMGTTVIDANHIDRAIDIPLGVSVQLDDLGIANGQAPDGSNSVGENGGGLNSPSGAILVLARVEFAHNMSGAGDFGDPDGYFGGAGGAICATGGSLRLTDSSLHENSTGAGGDAPLTGVALSGAGGSGGAVATQNTVVNIQSTSLASNHTGDAGVGALFNVTGGGGAIASFGSSLTIASSALDGNRTGTTPAPSGLGGAILTFNAIMGITQSSVTRNLSGSGGGLLAFGGSMTLSNMTVSSNVALSSTGGGLFVSGGTYELDFVTLTANEAPSGGGLHVEAGSPTAATVILRNSIVSGNFASTASDCEVVAGAGTVISLGYNLSGDGCPATSSTDIAKTNPQLAPLADNGGIGQTHMPSPTSPATDAANCASAGITTDQRNHARFIDVPRVPNAADACDIGAVELDDDIFWNGFD